MCLHRISYILLLHFINHLILNVMNYLLSRYTLILDRENNKIT